MFDAREQTRSVGAADGFASPRHGLTGAFISAVVSAQPHAEVPGSHVVRYDPADYPDVVNIDSHDWIVDLPAHTAWPRTVEISGLADAPELRALVREHAFGVPTFRDDHHHPHVPGDIARATPKRAPIE